MPRPLRKRRPRRPQRLPGRQRKTPIVIDAAASRPRSKRRRQRLTPSTTAARLELVVMKSGVFRRAMNPSEARSDAYAVVRALLTDRGANDCGVAGEATEQVLLDCHKIRGGQFWGTLAEEAEHHGVAPLIGPMITALARLRPEIVPDDVRRSFVALASRHRRAAVAREKCIDQLLVAFAT